MPSYMFAEEIDKERKEKLYDTLLWNNFAVSRMKLYERISTFFDTILPYTKFHRMKRSELPIKEYIPPNKFFSECQSIFV